MKEKSLLEYFQKNQGPVIHKWLHYFDIYERHFARFCGRELTMVEVGVGQGGSLRMWRDYFGERATIVGLDNREECRRFEEERIRIFCGDQADREFLRSVAKEIGPIDVILDDGGHRMDQQRITFEELYPHLSEMGLYMCEDTQSSYIPRFGGGCGQPNTFIEFVKTLIDQLNAWHSRDLSALPVSEFTKTTQSIHFYDGVVAIEKGTHVKPRHKRSGGTEGREDGARRKLNWTRILNLLIAELNYRSYLEIGVCTGRNFSRVRAPVKVGVDPDGEQYPPTFQMTSDEFFEQNREYFDLVFVDGLHHAEQMLRDVENALTWLKPSGTIVCHDVNPRREIHQRRERESRCWTGDCWKGWVELRATRPDLEMWVVDSGTGCGVIRRGNQEPIEMPGELSWDGLVENRKAWLNLVSQEDFVKKVTEWSRENPQLSEVE